VSGCRECSDRRSRDILVREETHVRCQAALGNTRSELSESRA
jgi:hypothetical protein